MIDCMCGSNALKHKCRCKPREYWDALKEKKVSKFKFEPKHFKKLHRTQPLFYQVAADEAQAALDAYLATCPVVYGFKCGHFVWSTFQETSNTHTAVLMNVMPIEKTPCEHEPDKVLRIEGFRCAKCGKKIQVSKWEAAE